MKYPLTIALSFAALFSLSSHTMAQDIRLSDPCGDPGVESMAWSVVRGKAIKVVDGDTIIILLKNKSHKRVHLVGVDAPKQEQAHERPSRLFLENLVLDKVVEVWVNTSVSLKHPQSKEVMGIVHLPKIEMLDVNLLMIQTGLARYQEPKPYSMSSYVRCHYKRAEGEARAARRGLWKEKS